VTSFGPIKSTFSGLKGPPFGESIQVTFEEAGLGITVHMGVSENGGTPKSSILIGFFHYKPSILGYPYFWKHPYLVEHMKFKLVFCCPKWLSKFWTRTMPWICHLPVCCFRRFFDLSWKFHQLVGETVKNLNPGEIVVWMHWSRIQSSRDYNIKNAHVIFGVYIGISHRGPHVGLGNPEVSL